MAQEWCYWCPTCGWIPACEVSVFDTRCPRCCCEMLGAATACDDRPALAMALRLAKLLRHDTDMPEDCENCLDDYGSEAVADWLRDEVASALEEA